MTGSVEGEEHEVAVEVMVATTVGGEIQSPQITLEIVRA